MTFVVGLLLGGTVMATAGNTNDDIAAAPGPVATATASPAASSGDRTITVPASCEQGLERARTALSTVGEAVEAARNFNSGRLQELLDRLQKAQQEVERLARQCRVEVPEKN
ncbi:hypothetical protein AB0C12_12750 [Actinoplanes sp. NPDC048967]|uniref:hypothetical protein n=1 Tax=Actinoplanes sp. NPDC048967 TaxID=3155269 RepID=UPI003411C267